VEVKAKLKKRKFEYVDTTENPETGGVKISSGKYENVVYQYGKVSFDEGDENLSMNFSYNVLENPKGLDLDDDPKFIETLGDILVQVLEDHLTDSEKSVSYDDMEFTDEDAAKSEINKLKIEQDQERENLEHRETDNSESDSQ